MKAGWRDAPLALRDSFLSNMHYATKPDIKNITHVDTSNFALKTNLANLKTKADILDIDKLAPVTTVSVN